MKTAFLGALLGLLVALCVPGGAASAHGALTAPVSRTAACGTEGGKNAQTPACRAAVAASKPGAAEAWDNLRVAGVNGRDRAVIPDGKLCSGGLGQYAGLDLPRTDWPATTVTPGAKFTFRYRTTIPHEGTFRMYVTKPAYQPGHALRWADLESAPFLTITDPRRDGDAYVLPGRLPVGRAGHHVVYTIWQNSSTPDTYYSCSDVEFRPSAATSRTAQPSAAQPSAVAQPSAGAQPSAVARGGSAGEPPAPAAGGTHVHGTAPSVEEIAPSPVAAQEKVADGEPAPTGMMSGRRWPVIAGVAAMLGVLGTIGALALHFRPRPRHRRG